MEELQQGLYALSSNLYQQSGAEGGAGDAGAGDASDAESADLERKTT